MHRLRFAAAALLGGLLVVGTVAGQPVVPEPKKDDPAKAATKTKEEMAKEEMAKGKEKESKPKPPEWPREIGGKDSAGYVKDLTDPDPHVRNVALQVLPRFGPDAKGVAGKAIVKALDREMATPPPAGGDTTVIVSAVNAMAALGLPDTEMKEATRMLGVLITAPGPRQALYRQYAIPVIASFGRKAVGGMALLIAPDVVLDRSYEIRRLVAESLVQVGQDEHQGPTTRVLEVLTGICIKDVSAAVRAQGFQSLVLLGPPVKPRLADDKGPPVVNKEMAARWLPIIKARVEFEKGNKGDKQVEVWGHMAVIRFDPEKELNDANLVALAKLIGNGETAVKLHALKAIELLGPLAAKQLDALIAALKGSDDVLVITQAVSAITAMKEKAMPALPALKEALEKRPEAYYQDLLKAATKSIEDAIAASGSEGTPTDPKPKVDPKQPGPKGPAKKP